MFNRKKNICYLLLIIHCVYVFSHSSTPTHSPTASPKPRTTDCVLLAGGKYIQSYYDSYGVSSQNYGILGYNTTTQQILQPKKTDSFLPKGIYSNGVINNFISSNSSLIFAGKFQKVKNDYSNSLGFANLEKLNNQTTISGMTEGVWNVGYKIPSPDTLKWPSLFFTNWISGKIVVAGPFSVVEALGNDVKGIAIYDEISKWSAFPNTNQLCSNCQIISVASSEEALFAVTMSTASNFETDLYSFSISSSTWHKFESLITPSEDENKQLRIAVGSLLLNEDSSFLFAIGYTSSISSPSIYDPVLNFYLLSWDTSSLSSPNVTLIWEKDCSGEENTITYPKITKITGSNDVAVTIPYAACSVQMTTFKRFTGVDDSSDNENAFIPINTLNSIDFLVSTEEEGELFISDTQTIYHLFSGHWVMLNIGVDQLGYSNDYEITALNYNVEYDRLYIAVRYLEDNQTSVLYWPYHNWENLLFSAEVFQSGSVFSLLSVHNNTQVMMGGDFQYVDHVKVNSIALWNGTSWIDQGINENLIVSALEELDGVIYALAYDPLNNYDYGSSFPIYYLDNNDGRWELMANAPVINIPYGQTTSFSMSNSRTLFAHPSSHSLFIGGDFYVLLNNGQTAQGLMSYSPETKQWSSYGVEFDQINTITILSDELLVVGGKFSVMFNTKVNTNIATYSLKYNVWGDTQPTSLEIQTIVPYKTYTTVAGGGNAQISSVDYFDYNFNHWSSSPVLPNTTYSISLLGDVIYAGGSYGVSKLDRNSWHSITTTLFQGDVYSTLILCNATSFIPVNTTSNGNNGENSSDYTSVYAIDCDDPQYKDSKACEVSQSNSGGVSIWGIVGLAAAVIFTIGVVGVIGFLFYLHKVKKSEEEVEYI